MTTSVATVYKLRVKLDIGVKGMTQPELSQVIPRLDFQQLVHAVFENKAEPYSLARIRVQGIVPVTPAEHRDWMTQPVLVSEAQWDAQIPTVTQLEMDQGQGQFPFFQVDCLLVIAVDGVQAKADSLLREYQANFRLAPSVRVLQSEYLFDAAPAAQIATSNRSGALAMLPGPSTVAPDYHTVDLNDIEQVKLFIVKAVGHLTGIHMDIVSPEGIGALVGLLMMPPPSPDQYIPNDYVSVEMYSMNQFIPEYRTFSTPYLPAKLAEDLFQYLCASNEYGGLVLRQRSGMIIRNKVAEEGGFILLVHRKSWNNPARHSWFPSKKDALTQANMMLRQDLKEDITRIEVIDFTNRKVGKQKITEISR